MIGSHEARKDEVKRLYDAAFPNDLRWNDWFFERVYRDDEVLVLSDDGGIVSALFLQKYDFSFHGDMLQMGYVSGAATDRRHRHRGYMSRLLSSALHVARERGDAIVGIIPATRRLYFFYDRFGFATVVYSEIERFTSLHVFPRTEGYEAVTPRYDAFHNLEASRPTTVIHSASDFENILEDIASDKGVAVQINNPEGIPVAMAFATKNENEIHVKEIFGTDSCALEMALGTIKSELDDTLPLTVWSLPGSHNYSLRAKGMLRIVNVEKILSSLAGHSPSVKMTVRVSDALLPENSGIYKLKDGKCHKSSQKDEKLDLDVTVDVLTRILFSSESVGEVFGFPTDRPTMSLMLD